MAGKIPSVTFVLRCSCVGVLATLLAGCFYPRAVPMNPQITFAVREDREKALEGADITVTNWRSLVADPQRSLRTDDLGKAVLPAREELVIWTVLGDYFGTSHIVYWCVRKSGFATTSGSMKWHDWHRIPTQGPPRNVDVQLLARNVSRQCEPPTRAEAERTAIDLGVQWNRAYSKF
jgi:hypothetical protein